VTDNNDARWNPEINPLNLTEGDYFKKDAGDERLLLVMETLNKALQNFRKS